MIEFGVLELGFTHDSAGNPEIIGNITVVVATRWNDSFDVVELGSDVLLIKPLAKRRF
jgi:hypothetical protein